MVVPWVSFNIHSPISKHYWEATVGTVLGVMWWMESALIWFPDFQYSSVQFSCSYVSNSLQPHGLQHFRPPCPSPAPGIYSNSCPLSWCCHPTISSCVVPFSSCPQSFLASGSFLMSQLFASGGQSTGASALASVLPMSIQSWLPLGLTGLISLLSNDSQESSPAAFQVDWAFGNLGYFIMPPGREVQSDGCLCLMESQHPCCHL